MFENDSDILYYIVRVDSKTYSLFNRQTDCLILGDVNLDKIKDFLLFNNPIHPALGSAKQQRQAPGSSPVIMPVKISGMNNNKSKQILNKKPGLKWANNKLVKKSKVDHSDSDPPSLPPPKILFEPTSGYD